MPFIHWEMRSRQLEMEFFILLKFLLNLLSTHMAKKSSMLALQELSTDDISFLWVYLQKFHSRAALEYQCNKTKVVSDQSPDVIQLFSIQPPDRQSTRPTDTSKIERPWGLLRDDLEIFRVLPPGNKATGSYNLRGKTVKTPQDVDKALRFCYRWYLERDKEIALADAYAEDTHPVHLRRTLDQSYYYMLDNTRSRDRDQVVSRYGRKLKREPVMMMVDQLVSIP
jgi:hypothetical protein